ncbi:putative porin [Chitinivorax tropicus]|uniref:Putative porin n=1 Tax=Chitinivorax tropicus TaxID=714531 RepID=A0A840MTV9_9PROT|nr:porin [Chitinivorax tropicus]MBB5018631.1 putative porin [Chitinivorax tropicus]
MRHLKMIAAAVATACLSMGAHADIKNVDIYGVVAFGLMSTEGADGHKNNEVLNESRIGFKGSKELKSGPKFIWQIETGFIGPNGLTARTYESGTFGTRDTWAGFEGSMGKVRVGRLVTPFGETLDWPYANGGVGPIVEATTVPGGGSFVRLSDQIRYDSPQLGPFTGSISVGRGDRVIPVGQQSNVWNDFEVRNSSVVSGMGHLALGPVTLHAGLESNRKRSAVSDSTNYLVGFETPIVGGLSAYGVWMRGKSELRSDLGTATKGDYTRNTYQLAAVYKMEDWIFKVTHAKNADLKGPVTDKGGSLTAVQALTFLDPSLVVFGRYVKNHDIKNTGWWNKSRVLLGLEYYF